MRTTVTLEPDVADLIRRRMAQRGLTFKQALNEAVREAGSRGRVAAAFETTPFDLGRPSVPIDGALRIAADLEDDEVRRELQVGR